MAFNFNLWKAMKCSFPPIFSHTGVNDDCWEVTWLTLDVRQLLWSLCWKASGLDSTSTSLVCRIIITIRCYRSMWISVSCSEESCNWSYEVNPVNRMVVCVDMFALICIHIWMLSDDRCDNRTMKRFGHIWRPVFQLQWQSIITRNIEIWCHSKMMVGSTRTSLSHAHAWCPPVRWIAIFDQGESTAI